MTKLTNIEGIGPVHAENLNRAGINSVEALLQAGATKKGREDLAGRTGVGEHVILSWTKCADLFRVPGVAGQYAELLEAAGVDTVPELAQRNPQNLYEKMAGVNGEKKLVRQLPSVSSITQWVTQAQALPRVINY